MMAMCVSRACGQTTVLFVLALLTPAASHGGCVGSAREEENFLYPRSRPAALLLAHTGSRCAPRCRLLIGRACV